MKLSVAMCNCSSVLNSRMCIALRYVLSHLLIDATTSEHSSNSNIIVYVNKELIAIFVNLMPLRFY